MTRLMIVGLGLIGGSMARALAQTGEYELIGIDCDEATLEYAHALGIFHTLAAESETYVREADVVILALHPRGIEQWLHDHASRAKQGAIISDVCGVKTAILEAAAQSVPHGVHFIGGHPMAGRETSGIQTSDAALFHGAHYILTPTQDTASKAIEQLKRIAQQLGCRDAVMTTAQEHDKLIAYTSQVMHVLAVAVCDDPELFDCKGFEGGSFRDCTRVAALDVPLWTQLFSMNRTALVDTIQTLEENLHAYRTVLESGDEQALREKLQYSSERKRRMNLE